MRAFDADVAAAQFTLSIFLMGFAFGQLLAGPLSDRFGRRPLLLWGMALYAAASVACALAGDFQQLTAARLFQALEAKLFEDSKDTIRLSSLISDVVDRETQEKIDIVRSRLIKYYGYNEVSATDVLTYVASIYARGDVKEKR